MPNMLQCNIDITRANLNNIKQLISECIEERVCGQLQTTLSPRKKTSPLMTHVELTWKLKGIGHIANNDGKKALKGQWHWPPNNCFLTLVNMNDLLVARTSQQDETAPLIAKDIVHSHFIANMTLDLFLTSPAPRVIFVREYCACIYKGMKTLAFPEWRVALQLPIIDKA